MQTKGQLVKNLNTAFSFAPPSILSLTIYPIKQILFYFFFYPITLAPNGMKESLAILKNCFPNGIPTIVIHHIQPTIRFPSAISHPKNIIHIRFTRNENMPFPYTISFPNGQNARVANLKHCRPTGIPIIVIHHMHPAKTQAKPPSNPPNINQRILPIVLMTIHPPYPMFNILLQFPLLSHISL